MVYFNICTKRTYTDKKTGKEKAVWLPVGTLKKLDDGKMFLELNMHPGVGFYIFEQKPKEESSAFGS